MPDKKLGAIARACRVQIIRMLTHAGSGHPGGSLSVIDLLVAIAFGRLRHDPTRPDWPDRDRIVLSKGHSVPALPSGPSISGSPTIASRSAAG
jgi:transketolase